MKQLSAPELRKFNEEIIPRLSEEFAGMGAGGLSSSGFQNAAVSAGTDLSERLGAIRAGLRSQGAAGLANIGQQSLGNYTQDVVTERGTEGGAGILSEKAGNATTQLVSHALKNNAQGNAANAPVNGPYTASAQLPEFSYSAKSMKPMSSKGNLMPDGSVQLIITNFADLVSQSGVRTQKLTS